MIIPEIGVITNVILNLSELENYEIQEEVGEAIKTHSLHTVPLDMREKPFYQVCLDNGVIINIHLKFDRFARHFDVVAVQKGRIMDKSDDVL